MNIKGIFRVMRFFLSSFFMNNIHHTAQTEPDGFS